MPDDAPPPPPSPPLITCEQRREELQLWFNLQKAKVQPLRDRVAAGTGPDSRLSNLNFAYCCGEPPCGDPQACCDRSIRALADAQRWLEQLNLTVPPAELACQNDLDSMCDFLDWWYRADQAQLKITNYANYLDRMSEDLGSMEALWFSIEDDCPLPVPAGPPCPDVQPLPG
ncbi:MAG TPA: hypothetical protein VFG68_12820 [Fimbriiglobus sp.]|nr:hypothetical protein [Fimbriiglobus sp.]